MKIDLSNGEVEYLREVLENEYSSAGSNRRILDKLPQTYSIGDRFEIEGEKYILLPVAPMTVGLINLQSGERLYEVRAENAFEVPQESVDELAGNREYRKL